MPVISSILAEASDIEAGGFYLSGITLAGQSNEKIAQRLKDIGIGDYQQHGNAAVFWDIFAISAISSCDSFRSKLLRYNTSIFF